MSQILKIFITVIITAIVAGGGVYIWQDNSPTQTEIKNQKQIKDRQSQVVQYNCEQSSGTFINDTCVCPIEADFGQTQEMMYDQKTGYCQTTHGGPGGKIGEILFGY